MRGAKKKPVARLPRQDCGLEFGGASGIRTADLWIMFADAVDSEVVISTGYASKKSWCV
jgi:hypothetical protein